MPKIFFAERGRTSPINGREPLRYAEIGAFGRIKKIINYNVNEPNQSILRIEEEPSTLKCTRTFTL